MDGLDGRYAVEMKYSLVTRRNDQPANQPIAALPLTLGLVCFVVRYLVPFTILTSFGTAVSTGQLDALLKYDEEAPEEADDAEANDADDDKKKK